MNPIIHDFAKKSITVCIAFTPRITVATPEGYAHYRVVILGFLGKFYSGTQQGNGLNFANNNGLTKNKQENP